MYIVCKPNFKVLNTVTTKHIPSLTASTIFSGRK